MTDLLQYLKVWAKEKVRRAPRTTRATWPAGESPYKVVLMLSILSAMHQKRAFRKGVVYYNDCVPYFEELYQTLYGPQDPAKWEPKIVQPFWYFGVGTPRVWRFVPNGGRTGDLDRIGSERKQIKSLSMLNKAVDHAEFSPEDFALLQDRVAARIIVAYLIHEQLPEHASFVGQLLRF